MKEVYALIIVMAIAAAGCGKASQESKGKDIPNSAKVVFAVGSVFVHDPSGKVPAKTDMAIPVGSTVETGDNSQCNILIGDASYISIKEKSRLVIESLLKKGGALEQSTLDLQQGRVVAMPKKLLRDEGFNVKARTAVAAVRGTKFVLENEPGRDVSVGVVEGKVEMKPFVPALDEKGGVADASALRTMRDKVDGSGVIVSENQTATVNTESVAALNRIVEKALVDMKEAKNGTVPPLLLNSVDKGVSGVGIIKEEKVSPRSAEEVRALDEAAQSDMKKRNAEKKESAVLTVTTPVKTSVIRLNGNIVGYGAATVRVDAEEAVKIDIRAKEFEDYRSEVTLSAGEQKIHEVALVRSKLLDRVAWSSQLGAGARGDLVFYKGMILSASSDGAVVCMDRNGTVQWRTALKGGSDATPAVANGRLFAVTKDEKLHALDAATGKTLWSAGISGSLLFGASPLVADEHVIVASSGGTVYSFGFDGKPEWSTDIKAGIFSTPTRNGDVIYVGADDHKLYAVTLRKGTIEWEAQLDSRIVASAPVFYQGRIYVGTYKGTLYCLNAGKGKTEWSMPTGGAIVASPVCFNGRVYVGSKDTKLYALDAGRGTVVWSVQTGQPVSAEVTIAGSELYAAAGRTVFSIDNATGRVNWSYELDGPVTSIAADGSGVCAGVGDRLVSLRTDLKDVIR